MRRNLGLDVFRSIAILMVLACHSLGMFYSSWDSAQPMVWALGLGVEVFFALSGFLIGDILIRDVVEQSPSVGAGRKLFAFYLRRWLRTLPLYYLMVFVSLYYQQWVQEWPRLSLNLSRFDLNTLVANLVFIQNFNPVWLQFQPVSWSLTIEEWFYLLIAPAMLAISFASQRRSRGRLLLAFGVTVVVVSMGARGAEFLLTHASWDIVMRQQIFLRMDALMFGVLAAWLRRYHERIYQRLALSRWFALLAAALAFAAAYWFVYEPFLEPAINDSIFTPSLGIALLGLSLGALVMVFHAQEAWFNRWLSGWLGWVFQYISTRSYGFYLIHWPIFIILQREVIPGSLTQHIELDLLALACTALFSEVAYRLWERPFMRLREHIHLIPRHAPAPATPVMPAMPIPVAAAFTTVEWEEAARLPVTEQVPRVRG